MRELLRPNAAAFVSALVDLLKSPNEMTRLAAFREFMDRLVGRPEQATDTTVRKFDMSQLYLEAARLAQPPPLDVTPSPDDKPAAVIDANSTTECGDQRKNRMQEAVP